MRLNDIARADDNRALDYVLELADVAWPAVPFKRSDRVRPQTQILPTLTFGVAGGEKVREDGEVPAPLPPRRTQRPPPLPLGVAADEKLREDGNIPVPLTQRRKLEPCNVESIEEIGAEAILSYCRLQGRVCPGNDAGVKSAFFGPAEPAEPPVFYDP